MKVITVFGSAQVKPGDADYQASQEVGRVLAEAGYAVMSGGYAGVMEAASRGAAEAGGHVIGVTTLQVEQYNGVRVNKWVTEEVKYDTLRDRILHMVQNSDGFVAMPGGVGTLHEIAETWELMRVNGIPDNPLICYGEHWERIISAIKDSPYVTDSYGDLMRFAHKPEDVVRILTEWHKA